MGFRLVFAGVLLAASVQPEARAVRAAAPGGVPTKSVGVSLPDDEGLLPERYGVSSEAVNANCLACHSAMMITTQPRLSRVQWGETIAKMRDVYGAPIDLADERAIIDWLVAD